MEPVSLLLTGGEAEEAGARLGGAGRAAAGVPDSVLADSTILTFNKTYKHLSRRSLRTIVNGLKVREGTQ